MPYRTAPPPSTDQRIRYGPFARQRRRIAKILSVALAGFVLCAFFVGRSESLRCDRQVGTCTATTKYLFVPVAWQRFSITAVSRVYSHAYTTSRTRGGHTAIELKNAPPLAVMNVLGDGWRPLFDEIHDFFADRKRARLTVASWPRPASLLMLLFPIGALFFLRSALRQPSAIDLTIVAPHTLRVRRRYGLE